MSVDLLIQVLPQRAQVLAERARNALLEADGSAIQSMAEMLDEREGPIGLVFTGQYNAGKSTLIAALTRRQDILIDSDVATAEVTRYQWGAVQLVDTPGVQAGEVRHDALTEEALRDSDLVVYVVSVDLLDDAAATHLDHVARGLGKRRSMVAVVNKCGTLDADAALQLAAVREALGPGATVPVVLTDALDYLDADAEPEPAVQAELRSEANVDGLAAALNGLTRQAGQESRLRRPFEKIAAVCADALEELADDPAEQAARKLVNRQRRLITASRRRLELAFETEFLEYRKRVLDFAEEVADAVDALDDLTGAVRQQGVESAESTFRKHADEDTSRLLDRIRTAIELEASRAAQETKELQSSPQLDVLMHSSPRAGSFAASRSATSEVKQPPSTNYQAILEKVGDLAGSFAAKWAPEGAKSARDYAGSFGHKTIYSIGKMVGKDWQPWQAVGWAKNVGNAAKAVNKAMPYVAIGLDAFMAIQADRKEGRFLEERQARRRRTLSDAERAASEVIADVKSRLDVAVAEFYGPALALVEQQQADLDRAESSRSGTREDLMEICAECKENLAVLDSRPDQEEAAVGDS